MISIAFMAKLAMRCDYSAATLVFQESAMTMVLKAKMLISYSFSQTRRVDMWAEYV
jgi:hypothetical protein